MFQRIGCRLDRFVSQHPSRLLAEIAALMVMMLLVVAACGESPSVSQQQKDQNYNNTQATNLHNVVQPPKVVNGEELKNQVARYQRLDNPAEIQYLYVFSGPLVFGPYQIIGKCSSTESLYSAPTTVSDANSITGQSFNSDVPVVIPAAQPDGSYGQNEAAIYCFSDDAQRTMIEFSQYMGWILREAPIVGLQTVQGSAVVPNGK